MQCRCCFMPCLILQFCLVSSLDPPPPPPQSFPHCLTPGKSQPSVEFPCNLTLQPSVSSKFMVIIFIAAFRENSVISPVVMTANKQRYFIQQTVQRDAFKALSSTFWWRNSLSHTDFACSLRIGVRRQCVDTPKHNYTFRAVH